jgi:hypothetical protein
MTDPPKPKGPIGVDDEYYQNPTKEGWLYATENHGAKKAPPGKKKRQPKVSVDKGPMDLFIKKQPIPHE